MKKADEVDDSHLQHILNANVNLQTLLELSYTEIQQRESMYGDMVAQYEKEKQEASIRFSSDLKNALNRAAETAQRKQLDADARIATFEQNAATQLSAIGHLEKMNADLRKKLASVEREKNESLEKISLRFSSSSNQLLASIAQVSQLQAQCDQLAREKQVSVQLNIDLKTVLVCIYYLFN